MRSRIAVSILGATGMVGQNLVGLLHEHPWFEVVDLAASERSAGARYEDSVRGRWYGETELPEGLGNMIVRAVRDFDSIPEKVTCVFSGADLGDKAATAGLEFEYASKGYALISTASANRREEDVPMMIPEINSNHMDVIPLQQVNHGLPKSGFVAVKPNCSIQSYIVVLDALKKADYPVKEVQVTTLQALSGAGHKGFNIPEWRENVIPFIAGEEQKTEEEPLKILGDLTDHGIESISDLSISAVCTRVPVIDGHTAVVHLRFAREVPSLAKFRSILTEYRSTPQTSGLPSAPEFPIIVCQEEDRPQPKLDRDSENGMAVTVGRIEEDRFFDIRFVGLSHNTMLGASGGAVLMAESLVDAGYIA